MSFDFSKLSPAKKAPRLTDPIALFQSLRITDPAINDLWLAQGDALREWDTNRASSDIAVVLNTGAGKTLVGLLAAQSLVNETKGHVVYACSSIQLVQQTASKARGYGLNVTTYIQGHESDTYYRRAMAPCITTYHALFNGLSRFFRDDLNAVVFDDAHTAGHLLRDQFTLNIRRNEFPGPFVQLVQLFRPYFTDIDKDTGYIETQDRQDAADSWFVPPFVVKQHLSALQLILLDACLNDSLETKFSWKYLQNNIDTCAVFVSGSDVTFTPANVPMHVLPYFGDGVRRLYLSATLVAKDAFLRSFGREPDLIIAPSTTAGECERLILIPRLKAHSGRPNDDIGDAKEVLIGQKSLVLVPTHNRAKRWESAAAQRIENVAEQIEQFKKADDPVCLILTARYDGIDLPGDTCRVLVIDDLPTGLNPLERYLWERLGLFKLLRSTVASRIVQSFGRISRGMSDHGVVILTGSKLVDWILTPKNQSMLPEFLQSQLQLGIEVSEQLGSVDDLAAVVRQCLSRDPRWNEYYRNLIDEYDAFPIPEDDSEMNLQVTRDELEFGKALWERDYAHAAKALDRNLDETFTVSRSTGAWHALWLGYCFELLGSRDEAEILYRRANRADKNIPPFIRQTITLNQDDYSPQVRALVASLLHDNPTKLTLPRRFDMDLALLDGSGSVPQTEAALESLGEYLGLEARRPDNEEGTGPDVLWLLPDGSALSIEAKTEKTGKSYYRKDDLGQLRDHRRWVAEHVTKDVLSVFVGPVLPASKDANPDPDTMVIELEAFREVRDRLRSAIIDTCDSAIPATAASTVQSNFSNRELLWPVVYHGLPKHILIEVAEP